MRLKKEEGGWTSGDTNPGYEMLATTAVYPSRVESARAPRRPKAPKQIFGASPLKTNARQHRRRVDLFSYVIGALSVFNAASAS